jgi:hypothetical protein
VKDLTLEELNKAPGVIRYIFAASSAGLPVSGKLVDQATKDYPQYFQEEIERKTKWNAIPEEIRKAYLKETTEKYMELYGSIPNSRKGIWYWCNHPEEYKGHEKAYEEIQPKLKQIEIELYNKYIKKYDPEGLFMLRL